MLLAAPNAVRKKDHIRYTPLHYATKNDNVDAIKLFVDAYPEAVLEENNRNETPLHFAAVNSWNKNMQTFQNNDIIKLLIRAYPKALFTTASDGILNFDDIKSIVVKWSYQALERHLPLILLSDVSRKRKRRSSIFVK